MTAAPASTTLLFADSFLEALARLSTTEKSEVERAVETYQQDPENQLIALHRVVDSDDPHFWSIRASDRLRVILHRQETTSLFCYADQHDVAYQWARQRRLEVHPHTGAAQMVQAIETVSFPTNPSDSEATYPLRRYSSDTLFEYGIPTEWIEPLRQLPTRTELLQVVGLLPREATEATLELAKGRIPRLPQRARREQNPFGHPDALRRFRQLDTQEEIRVALRNPWDQWTIFLHPSQRELVERDYNGPARISGSAGTGKTIVGLHRARHLLRQYSESRILITTPSDLLARVLRQRWERLTMSEPTLRSRATVAPLRAVARELYHARSRQRKVVDGYRIQQLIYQASREIAHEFSLYFLLTEWQTVIDPLQIRTWKTYRDLARQGRLSSISAAQRQLAWAIFERVWLALEEAQELTEAGMYHHLADDPEQELPFRCVIVDEAQDLNQAEMYWLGQGWSKRQNGLFFIGDLGQRTIGAPFAWDSQGVAIRGRSHMLRINYRTSHQIRETAEGLLTVKLPNLDGPDEDRRLTQSVFNGPRPQIQALKNREAEQRYVADWIQQRMQQGYNQEEIALIVRSEKQLRIARAAVAWAGQTAFDLWEDVWVPKGEVVITTMEQARGLEFKAVAIMACEEGVLPDPDRLEEEAVTPEDLKDLEVTERQMLYVACTRAREVLSITYVGQPSPFIFQLYHENQ